MRAILNRNGGGRRPKLNQLLLMGPVIALSFLRGRTSKDVQWPIMQSVGSEFHISSTYFQLGPDCFGFCDQCTGAAPRGNKTVSRSVACGGVKSLGLVWRLLFLKRDRVSKYCTEENRLNQSAGYSSISQCSGTMRSEIRGGIRNRTGSCQTHCWPGGMRPKADSDADSQLHARATH